MPLLALPNELLLQIAGSLVQVQSSDCDCHCHCHHISSHLSAFSRSNQHLHGLLAEYLLATASTLHMLFWAIANSRNDTVALALKRGADPNTPLRPHSQITPPWHPSTTPVDLAMSMRAHSADAHSHALKLSTIAQLFSAGGVCTVRNLIMPTRYGDLDLLTLSLPHLSDDDIVDLAGPRKLLEIAARLGHVQATQLTIDAGATVNSIGDRHHEHFYPPLWVCWQAPIGVLQVLLDAGADATWCSRHGVSIVQRMREMSMNTPELEEKIALLVRYGAVDQRSFGQTLGAGGPLNRYTPEREYRGWVPGGTEVPVDWPRTWMLAGREAICACLCCYREVSGG